MPLDKPIVVLGFYRDEHNHIRPITKKRSELLRKKIIANPKMWKGIGPRKKEQTARDIADGFQFYDLHLEMNVRLHEAVAKQFPDWLKHNYSGRKYKKAKTEFLKQVAKTFGKGIVRDVGKALDVQAQEELENEYESRGEEEY